MAKTLESTITDLKVVNEFGVSYVRNDNIMEDGSVVSTTKHPNIIYPFHSILNGDASWHFLPHNAEEYGVDVLDFCNKTWTDEVKEKYKTHIKANGENKEDK